MKLFFYGLFSFVISFVSICLLVLARGSENASGVSPLHIKNEMVPWVFNEIRFLLRNKVQTIVIVVTEVFLKHRMT